MQGRDGSDPPRGAGEGRVCPFAGLWRLLRHGFELYRVCWRENLLLRPFRRRTDLCGPPSNLSFPKLIEKLNSTRATHPCAPIGLVLGATASVVLSVGAWLMLGVSASMPSNLIMTAKHEARSEQLPDGSVLTIDARSTVQVNVTPRERVANVELGTVMFDVKSGLPFAVHTFLARALVTATAKFRVVVDESSVEFAVEEGAILLYDRNAKSDAPALKLEKGQSRIYNMRIARVASMIAEPDGRVCVRTGG